MAKTYYAHVVHWIKEDPASPGYTMSKGVAEILQSKNTPEVVKPEFFNEAIYEKFLETQFEVEWFTSVTPGLVSFVHKNDISFIIFDSEEKLNEYNSDKRELDIWPQYEKARDDFVKLLKVKILVHPVIALEANDVAQLYEVAIAKIDELLKG